MAKVPLRALRESVGDDRVMTQGRRVIVRPSTVDDLSRAVEILSEAGCSMATGGVGDAVLDLGDLNRVVEINEADRYVTVEAGCTWRMLATALGARRLRTPVGGRLGGSDETIGSGVDNNLHFYGAGIHGTLSDTVIGLDVVLADGTLVETGAAAAEGRTPFLRQFGPDLTGLFLGDGGAFGVKARVTLPVLPQAGASAGLSFAFERFEDVALAHVALAREGLAAEHWSFDPERNELLAGRGHRVLEGVPFSRNGTIPLRGDRERAAATPTLIDGHRIVDRGGWSLHLVTEAESDRQLDERLGQIRRVVLPSALRELPPAIADIVRTRSGNAGELLTARHPSRITIEALFPLSRAAELAAVTDEYFVRHRELAAKQGIAATHMTSATPRAFVIATTVSWPVPTAEKPARVLADDLALLWGAFGATYHRFDGVVTYPAALSSAALALARTLKHALDPRGLINPGALGFGGAAQPTSKMKFDEFPQNLLEEKRP